MLQPLPEAILGPACFDRRTQFRIRAAASFLSAACPAPIHACLGKILERGAVQAARLPALTRAHWSEWTKHWPISWRVPSLSKADPQSKLAATEVASMKAWMQRALQEARLAKEYGPVSNAAFFVNPEAGQAHLLSVQRPPRASEAAASPRDISTLRDVHNTCACTALEEAACKMR